MPNLESECIWPSWFGCTFQSDVNAPHVYSYTCCLLPNACVLIFQLAYCWPFLSLEKIKELTADVCDKVLSLPPWAGYKHEHDPCQDCHSFDCGLQCSMLRLNSAWSLTQTDKSHGLNVQNNAEEDNDRLFCKLQSWPHVRVVSVIVLWMMRPLLIPLHSSLPYGFFFFFFPLYLPENSDKTSVSVPFCPDSLYSFMC